MNLRRPPIAAAVAAAAVPVLLLVPACSSSDDASSSTTTAGAPAQSSTTTASAIGGNVTAPVVLSPSQTTATVAVGQVVTFDMGEPGEGTFVATSDDAAVFEVTGEGRVEGSATFNAGGEAVGAGVAEVVVQFEGATNGLGTPTRFTITVE
jgi:hypothetical protein